jgi:hypothetical protein
MFELGFVRGSHDHESGKTAKISQIEAPGVRCAIGPYKAGTVEREANRQMLDGDIVYNLIVSALQEGRINGSEGFHTFDSEARREGNTVLLGNADVETAVWELLLEKIKAGP